METEIISVSTLTDKEEVAHQLRKYDLLALPVLDNDGLLVGIVTFDDAMDVMVEEATEDITKMAAVSPSEKTYFEVSAWEHAKRRIPWLLVLMFSLSSPEVLSPVMKTLSRQSLFWYPSSRC